MAKIEKTPTQLQKADAGFSAKTDVVGPRQVRATFSIRRSQEEPAYVKQAVFDFGGVSDEELLLMSMYQAKVKCQALLRAMPTDKMLDAATMATIDVKKDLLEAAPRTVDPDARAVAALTKVGVDEATARQMVADAKSKATKGGGKTAKAA